MYKYEVLHHSHTYTHVVEVRTYVQTHTCTYSKYSRGAVYYLVICNCIIMYCRFHSVWCWRLTMMMRAAGTTNPQMVLSCNRGDNQHLHRWVHRKKGTQCLTIHTLYCPIHSKVPLPLYCTIHVQEVMLHTRNSTVPREYSKILQTDVHVVVP